MKEDIPHREKEYAGDMARASLNWAYDT